MQKLGIIILNYNGDSDALDLLERVSEWKSIYSQIYYVVIQEEDLCLDINKENIKVIQSRQNFGFGGNNNLGLAESIADNNDWTLLMNNDARIEEKDVLGLLERIETLNDPKIFSVAPSLKETFGQLTKVYVGGRDISKFMNTRIEAHEMESTSLNYHEVFYNIGAIVFFKNEYLTTLGILDENYFFSGEIADLCYRANKNGLRSITFLDIVGSHFPENHSKRKSLYKYYSLRNRFLFIRKHALNGWLTVPFYKFLLKDILYHILYRDFTQIKTNLICLIHILFRVTGNQNEKFGTS